MTINEFLFFMEQPFAKVLITMIGILLSIIVILYKSPKKIKQITYLMSSYYYKIYNKQKVKTDIQTILKKANVAVSIYDEIIGHFDSTHVGVYSFHNGTISLDNFHLYKLSMIDERSRHYTLIQKNQDIPANILTEIIDYCKNNDYYELNKKTTLIIFLKEQLTTLESINYTYWSIQWEEGIPAFALTISTKERLSKHQLKDILKYRLLLHQIYNNIVETKTYDLLKR